MPQFADGHELPPETSTGRLRVSEVFTSIQGEGLHTGVRSTFIRLTGCNLRCWFCDTPETSWSPAGEWLTVEEIVRHVEREGCEHVVVTGGEPLLQPDVVTLTEQLQQAGLVVTIETAATVDRPVVADLMSISPKMSNSTPNGDRRWALRHERDRFRPAVVRRFLRDYNCQLKFVIDKPDDLEEVVNYLDAIPEVDRSQVFLMPQATSAEELATRLIWLRLAADEMEVRVSNRLHIELFGHQRGT